MTDGPSTALAGRHGAAVVLALGSNLGDRLGILQECVNALAAMPEMTVMAVSPVYQTAPIGGPEQPDYLNAVVLGQTTLPPGILLDQLHVLEAAAGRVRTVRFGPRTLDVDIIAYDAVRSDDPDLTLPHPRAHERAFVLAPWLDVDPEAVIPGRGSVAALLAAADASGVRRAGGSLAIPDSE